MRTFSNIFRLKKFITIKMNEKLRTSRALTDGGERICRSLANGVGFGVIGSVTRRYFVCFLARRRKAKDEYLECRCLSHRFIFIHFTNTREGRSGQAKLRRSKARAEASNVDRLASAISIFSLHSAPRSFCFTFHALSQIGRFFIVHFDGPEDALAVNISATLARPLDCNPIKTMKTAEAIEWPAILPKHTID
jgi:hypothetical protein